MRRTYVDLQSPLVLYGHRRYDQATEIRIVGIRQMSRGKAGSSTSFIQSPSATF